MYIVICYTKIKMYSNHAYTCYLILIKTKLQTVNTFCLQLGRMQSPDVSGWCFAFSEAKVKFVSPHKVNCTRISNYCIHSSKNR